MRTFRLPAAAVGGLAMVAALSGLTAPASAAPDASTPITATNTEQSRYVPRDDPHAQIIGGTKTSHRDTPFIIAGLREGGGGPGGQSCTSSVVGKRVVLTAGHCMVDAAGAKSYVYGRDNLNDSSVGETYKVVKYVPHPDYKQSGDWQKGYDLALALVDRDIKTVDGTVGKIATSADGALKKQGNTGLAQGWGKTESGAGSPDLLKVDLPVNENCGSEGGLPINQKMICTGYKDGSKGTCQGDSGGPLIVKGVIIGVTSWGRGDCKGYSIYADLAGAGGDWANKTLKELDGGGGEPGSPSATFESSCKAGTKDCSFDASGSSSPNGSVSGYAWDFGDGQTGTGVSPTHTYASTGTYTVKLTITDSTGKTGTTTRDVRVGGGGGQAPTAQFTVFCQSSECDFDASMSRDPDGSISSYAWEFGDSQTGTGVKTSHGYPAREGSYDARLTVTDDAGNAVSTVREVSCVAFGTQVFCHG